MSVTNWMSWEGGVDLAAYTKPGLAMPNVVVHVARAVHTPVGSAASGLVLFQPDLNAPPQIMGFVSHEVDPVGNYFGPSIFAGTPFEKAPVLKATIQITVELPDAVSATVTVGGLVLKTRLTDLKALELIHRPAGALPYVQQGLEAAAGNATFSVNGNDVPLIVPPVGMSGGPGAVWAPAGIYAR